MTQHEVPAQVRPTYDAIVSLTDHFCQAHLTPEYQLLCRKLAGVLAQQQPSSITRGKPSAWASGIVRVVGWANFLDDSSQKPHMKMGDIDQKFGVSQATGQAKAKAIRDMVTISPLDPGWSLRSRVAESPLAGLLQATGLVVHKEQTHD